MVQAGPEFGLSADVRAAALEAVRGFAYAGPAGWAGPDRQDTRAESQRAELAQAAEILERTLDRMPPGVAQRAGLEGRLGEVQVLLNKVNNGFVVPSALLAEAIKGAEAAATTAAATGALTITTRMALAAGELAAIERRLGLESISGAESYEEAVEILNRNFDRVAEISERADAYYAEHGYETVLSEEERRELEELERKRASGITLSAEEMARAAELGIEDAEAQITFAEENGLDTQPAEDKRDGLMAVLEHSAQVMSIEVNAQEAAVTQGMSAAYIRGVESIAPEEAELAELERKRASGIPLSAEEMARAAELGVRQAEAQITFAQQNGLDTQPADDRREAFASIATPALFAMNPTPVETVPAATLEVVQPSFATIATPALFSEAPASTAAIATPAVFAGPESAVATPVSEPERFEVAEADVATPASPIVTAGATPPAPASPSRAC